MRDDGDGREHATRDALTRKRTNTERGRAAKLRAKQRARGRLTAAERRWLAAYGRATTAHKARKTSAPTAKKRKPRRRAGAKRDALQILTAWGDWAGGMSAPVVSWHSGREPRRGRPGSAVAVADVEMHIPAATDVDAFADLQDELGMPTMPPESGRGASVKLKIKTEMTGRKPMWVSLGNLSSRWQEMTDDAIAKLFEMITRYYATDILAISIYVTGHKYTD